MKTTKIDMKIFDQMLDLSHEDMHELVETVGLSACFNADLNKSHEQKIIVAISMLRHVYTMLEQCSCDVHIRINNSAWTEDVSYTTGQNKQEEL